jgi:hypothetical protein
MAARHVPGQPVPAVADPDRQVESPNAGEISEYIGDMVHELAAMADRQKLDAVAHFLRLAEVECRRRKPGRSR